MTRRGRPGSAGLGRLTQNPSGSASTRPEPAPCDSILRPGGLGARAAGPRGGEIGTGRRSPVVAALVALALAAAACRGGAPAPAPAPAPGADGADGAATAAGPGGGAPAPADPGTVAELRALVGELAAAGAAGDSAACRAHLSRASRALFDELAAAGGAAEEPAAGGWAAPCAAHAALVWPAGATATVTADAARATVTGRGVEGQPFRVPFVREGGRWRVDYAAHPDAPAVSAQAAAGRAARQARSTPAGDARAPVGASLAPDR
jgi:hypothetical protein